MVGGGSGYGGFIERTGLAELRDRFIVRSAVVSCLVHSSGQDVVMPGDKRVLEDMYATCQCQSNNSESVTQGLHGLLRLVLHKTTHTYSNNFGTDNLM